MHPERREVLEIDPLVEERDKKIMALPNRKFQKLLRIATSIFALAIILLIVTALLSGRSVTQVLNFKAESPSVGDVAFDQSSNTFVLSNVMDGSHHNYLTITLNQNLISFFRPELGKQCRVNLTSPIINVNGETDEGDDHVLSESPQLCMKFNSDFNLVVYETSIDGVSCHSFHWASKNVDSSIMNCLNLGDVNWYGGGGLTEHRWPLNRADIPIQPFITRKYVPSKETSENRFDSFIEPYFLSADGVAVMIDQYSPLFVSTDGSRGNKRICFQSKLQSPYESKTYGNVNSLKFKVCKDRSAKSIHSHLLKAEKIFFPFESPDEDLMLKPIWSTRGRNYNKINQNEVIEFVNNIFSSKLLYSQLFIDGNYSRADRFPYFDEQKFSHSLQLIMDLSREDPSSHLPLKVGTELFPHISTGQFEKFAIQNSGKIESSTNGNSKNAPLLLDIYSEEAVTWFKEQLKEFSTQVLVSRFRFSGGDAYSIHKALEKEGLQSKLPVFLNDYTTLYAEIASEFGSFSVVGNGFKSQQDTSVADAGPFTSHWGHERKGLKSVIPTAITYGLLGYPFVLVGPVGGVGTSQDESTGQISRPEKELFIRWLQLSAYLPLMEFSVGPWEFDDPGGKLANYTRQLLEWRRDYLWEKYMASAFKEASSTGWPIIRPLWWIAPEDPTAQFIDCEFLVGNSLLVAPVLQPQARARDVYLPSGFWWHDDLTSALHKGGSWLRRYPVDLYQIATFTRKSAPKSVVQN